METLQGRGAGLSCRRPGWGQHYGHTARQDKAASRAVADQPCPWQVTGTCADAASALAAARVCPSRTATRDAVPQRASQRQLRPARNSSGGPSPEVRWCHLATLALGWGDCLALPVPAACVTWRHVPAHQQSIGPEKLFWLRKPDTARVGCRLTHGISSALQGLVYSPRSPDPQPPQGRSLHSKKTLECTLPSLLFHFKPHLRKSHLLLFFIFF